MVDSALDVAQAAMDGEEVSGKQLMGAKMIMTFAPKIERDSGQPVHLHLSVPRPKTMESIPVMPEPPLPAELVDPPSESSSGPPDPKAGLPNSD